MRTLLIALVAASVLSSASKPNFSGTWKLNVAKSDFGQAPAPKFMTTRIEHHDPEVKVHSEISGLQGTYETDYKWITDGRENVNTIRGNEIRASVVWSGSSLISNAKTTSNGAAITIVDNWSMSDNGHTLTVARTVIAPQGNAEQTYVYEK